MHRVQITIILLFGVVLSSLATTPQTWAADGPAFTAVARLNIAGYRHRRHCTATLIAPDLALTARHCLKANVGNGFVRPGALHLIFGYRTGGWAEHKRVAKWFFPKPKARTRDIAVLQLTEPSALPPIPLADLSDLKALVQSAEPNIVQAGYGSDRAHALSVDAACRLVGSTPTNHWRHTCAAVSGESGGPLLAAIDGRWRVVAVHSGRTSDGTGVAEPVDAGLYDLVR